MSESSGKPSRRKGSDRPTQKEINNLGIRDGVATEWHDLGVELLPDDLQVQLDIIGSNKSANVKACSTQMFQYWLQVDTTASWNKLIEALKEIKKYQLAETICRKVLQEEPSNENTERNKETEESYQRRPIKRKVETHDTPSHPVGKKQEPSRENTDRKEETEESYQKSPVAREVDTNETSSIPVGIKHNNNGTNGSPKRKKGDSSTTQTKTRITYKLCIVVSLTVSVVILAIYIQQDPHNLFGSDASPKEQKPGLQQKEEDVSSVQESTHQTEGTREVPKPTNRGNSKESKVLREYNDELANILPVNNIMNKLIAEQIITRDDKEEIKGLPKSKDRASHVLDIVAKSLQAGITDDFYSLLGIMEQYEGAVAKVANKIREGLN